MWHFPLTTHEAIAVGDLYSHLLSLKESFEEKCAS